jgi:HSP20 family protein
MKIWFNDFFDEFERISSDLWQKHLEPLVYVEDKGYEFILTTELPGVKKEDIEINVTENSVDIKAKLKKSCRFHRWGTVHKEVNFECFHKLIRLPSLINPEKAKASFKRSILKIKLPKRHEKRRIKVE